MRVAVAVALVFRGESAAGLLQSAAGAAAGRGLRCQCVVEQRYFLGPGLPFYALHLLRVCLCRTFHRCDHFRDGWGKALSVAAGDLVVCNSQFFCL